MERKPFIESLKAKKSQMKEDMKTARDIEQGTKRKEIVDESVVEHIERGVEIKKPCVFLSSSEYSDVFSEPPNERATNTVVMPDDEGGEEKLWFFRTDGTENQPVLMRYRHGNYFTKKTISNTIHHLPIQRHRFARQSARVLKCQLKKSGIAKRAWEDVPTLRQELRRTNDETQDGLHLELVW